MCSTLLSVMAQQEIFDPGKAYEIYQVAIINTHSHTSISDAEGFGCDPTSVIQKNFRHFDGIILTDHGGHISAKEWADEQNYQQSFSGGNKICLSGFEVTGTDELGFTSSKDPAYQPGWGHIVVVGTGSYCERRVYGNGNPPVIVPTFQSFTDWLESYPTGMAIFAHPSLYMIERSFDGFAPPRTDQAVRQFVGCELSSHGLEYSGLGNGTELRSSNEACYRKLLREGWRLGAYMSGDEHLPPFGSTNTVTGMYVREKSVSCTIEAMAARRTFATEEPGANIKLVVSSESEHAIMGGEISIQKEAVFHASCSSPKTKVETISLVFISTEAGHDLVQVSQHLGNNTDHWGMIVSKNDLIYKKTILVYAKAKLENGKNLVSSPIWLNTR